MDIDGDDPRAVADAQQYREQGLLVKQVLSAAQAAACSEAALAALAPWRGDRQMGNIQFLQPRTAIAAIQPLIAQTALLGTCRAILGGGEVVLDGASLFYAERGVDYRQGWHRDVMQLAEHEVIDDWFSDGYFHNNVQVNLALLPDACLWLVKGSHARLFTAQERSVFAGSKRMAPLDGEDPALGECIALAPGQAVFYNNLAIHRGYGGVLAADRLTVQLGFHSSRAAPTCHFDVLNHHEYTDDYLATLEAPVRTMLAQHVAQRRAWADSGRYFQRHRRFVQQAFQVV